MKNCTKCGISKTLDNFGFNKAAKDGLTLTCKQCQKNYREANKERTSEYMSKYMRERRYGMTNDQYEEMLKNQDNKCPITGNENNPEKTFGVLAVDHCHNCNQVRGLIDFDINKTIGIFKDDPALVRKVAAQLLRAADYLDQHQCK